MFSTFTFIFCFIGHFICPLTWIQAHSIDIPWGLGKSSHFFSLYSTCTYAEPGHFDRSAYVHIFSGQYDGHLFDNDCAHIPSRDYKVQYTTSSGISIVISSSVYTCIDCYLICPHHNVHLVFIVHVAALAAREYLLSALIWSANFFIIVGTHCAQLLTITHICFCHCTCKSLHYYINSSNRAKFDIIQAYPILHPIPANEESLSTILDDS